jgi:hypothetical protein
VLPNPYAWLAVTLAVLAATAVILRRMDQHAGRHLIADRAYGRLVAPRGNLVRMMALIPWLGALGIVLAFGGDPVAAALILILLAATVLLLWHDSWIALSPAGLFIRNGFIPKVIPWKSGRELPRTKGLLIDPAFLAAVIQHYTDHPECRAAIAQDPDRELTRLRSLSAA